MRTYSHVFFTWVLAKHGVRAGRAGAIASAVGAALPDLPSFAATAYYIGPAFFTEGWDAMHSEGDLDAIYFTGPFGATGSALHSLLFPAVLLGLYYVVLRLGSFDRRRVLLWFLLGWAGHTVADFLTHVHGTRPLFWPISGWEWSSPVSYYDPNYYGLQFTIAIHAGILIIVVVLLLRRLRRRALRGSRKKP